MCSNASISTPALVVLAVSCLAGCAVPAPGPDLGLLDLEGNEVAPLAADAVNVFLFTRTDCPISNRYAPEVRRLHEDYAPRDVAFWLVYVDPDEDPAVIRRHLDDYDYPLPAIRDPEHALVAHAGATITPEVAVFVGVDRMVYRGRIDDRYVDFGTARAEATRHDLRLALDAVLEGRPVETSTTAAVGCFIADLE